MKKGKKIYDRQPELFKTEAEILINLQKKRLIMRSFSPELIIENIDGYISECIDQKQPPDITDFLQHLGITSMDLVKFLTDPNDVAVKQELLFSVEKIIAFYTKQNIKYHNPLIKILDAASAVISRNQEFIDISGFYDAPKLEFI